MLVEPRACLNIPEVGPRMTAARDLYSTRAATGTVHNPAVEHMTRPGEVVQPKTVSARFPAWRLQAQLAAQGAGRKPSVTTLNWPLSQPAMKTVTSPAQQFTAYCMSKLQHQVGSEPGRSHAVRDQRTPRVDF